MHFELLIFDHSAVELRPWWLTRDAGTAGSWSDGLLESWGAVGVKLGLAPVDQLEASDVDTTLGVWLESHWGPSWYHHEHQGGPGEWFAPLGPDV